MLCDGRTVEVTRLCTDGTRNAASKLYGAIVRAAKALGYKRAFTYTLPEEGGASLKASGWKMDGEVTPEGWGRRGKLSSRKVGVPDLFGGIHRHEPRPRLRWRIDL